MSNSCYTYFAIVGKFDPDEVTKILNLKPDKASKMGDRRINGTICDSARWEFGRCDEYDSIVERQMEKTISPLYDKISLFSTR